MNILLHNNMTMDQEKTFEQKFRNLSKVHVYVKSDQNAYFSLNEGILWALLSCSICFRHDLANNKTQGTEGGFSIPS